MSGIADWWDEFWANRAYRRSYRIEPEDPADGEAYLKLAAEVLKDDPWETAD